MAALKPIKTTYPSPDDVVFDHLSHHCKEYYQRLCNIKVIPPRNRNSGYSDNLNYYIINDERVGFNERQLNYATILATTDLTLDEAYVKAGYSWVYVFAYNKHIIKGDKLTVSHLRSNIRAEADKAKTPRMTALVNYLKRYSLEKIVIDATWLLNEQVNLYMESRKAKSFGVAAKVLNDISHHIDVDARAANKVEIDNTVDYAKILNEAYNRSSKVDTKKAELNTIIDLEVDKTNLDDAILKKTTTVTEETPVDKQALESAVVGLYESNHPEESK